MNHNNLRIVCYNFVGAGGFFANLEQMGLLLGP
jgi:hypothetical protein